MERGGHVFPQQYVPQGEPTGRGPRASSSTASREGCERLIAGRRSRQSSRPPRASELAELEHDELTIGTPESLSETRGAKTMKETIGNFLLRRLEEVEIRHIFGVPGDFNLEFVQQLEDRRRPEWVGNCNELESCYAADGYARLNGPAALVVTNGVGALSAIN